MPTIGCDPELILLEDPPLSRVPIIPAQELFGDLNLDIGDAGGIGRDGSRILAEIRPSPSTNPEDVVGNMCHLLKRIVEVGRSRIRLAVGTYREQVGGIGGHFHAWGREATQRKINSRASQEAICLGVSLLWRLEDYDGGVLRRRAGYGGITDVRNSNHSKEFRSPSADWMAHPTLAKHSLSYFKSVVENADRLFRDPLQRKELMNKAAYFWKPETPVLPAPTDNPELPPDDPFAQRPRAYLAGGEMTGTARALIEQLYGTPARAPAPRAVIPREQILKNNARDRDTYLTDVIKEVKKVVRTKDLTTIDFFVEKIDKLRETDKLIRLDLNKWRIA